MNEKKEEYEKEIGKILRKVMENSYQRKKNREEISILLKSIRKEETFEESTIKEYLNLKKRVLSNLSTTK